MANVKHNIYFSIKVIVYEMQVQVESVNSTSIEKGVQYPDSKVHVAYMGPTWVMSAPGRPRVGPMNLALWGNTSQN